MIAARVAVEIAKNFAMAIPLVRRWRLQRPRGTSLATQAYVDHILHAYVEPVAELGIEGKSILEIGPGDSLLSAVTFLALGARRYTAIDRFQGNYGSVEAQRWYEAMSRRLGPLPEPSDPRITVIPQAVETAGEIGKFDIVCSHAVGEHVVSVPAFAELTRRSLTPEGTALHIVDFSGHHWHRDGDPDFFRRFPEWLWQAMGSHRGVPNRVPYPEFVGAFTAAGMQVSATRTSSHAEIHARI